MYGGKEGTSQTNSTEGPTETGGEAETPKVGDECSEGVLKIVSAVVSNQSQGKGTTGAQLTTYLHPQTNGRDSGKGGFWKAQRGGGT